MKLHTNLKHQSTFPMALLWMILLIFSTNGIAQNIEIKSNQFSKKDHHLISSFIDAASGYYSNKAQADTTDIAILKHTEIRVYRIWTNRKNEYWVSMGWFQPGFHEPLGEKIFHLHTMHKDTMWVDCYSWDEDPSQKAIVKQWESKHPYKKLSPDDLNNDGCTNIIINKGNGAFELKTKDGQTCVYHNSLAPFDGIQFQFVFDGKLLKIYDKNFKKGKLKFHYQNTPLLMQKMAEEVIDPQDNSIE